MHEMWSSLPSQGDCAKLRRDARTLCRKCGREYDRPHKVYFDMFPGPSYSLPGKGTYESGARGKGNERQGKGAGAKGDKGADNARL